MRPKKPVLMVCPDELAGPLWRFALVQWRYQVTLVTSAKQAHELLDVGSYAVLILFDGIPFEEFGSLLTRQESRRCGVLVYDPLELRREDVAESEHVIYAGRGNSSLQVRGWVQQLSRRKRGPAAKWPDGVLPPPPWVSTRREKCVEEAR